MFVFINMGANKDLIKKSSFKYLNHTYICFSFNNSMELLKGYNKAPLEVKCFLSISCCQS